MSKTVQESLDTCLFFTVKKLDRILNKMADEAFSKVGLTPTYAFIILILAEEDGKLQKDIARMLFIAPSTLTRFLEKLIQKRYVTTIVEGRTSRVYLTEIGRKAVPSIQLAWDDLHHMYGDVIGDDYADELATEINDASEFFHNY